MRPQILHKDSNCTRKSTDNHYQRLMMIHISPNSFKNYENQAHLLSDGTKKFRSRIIVVFASSNRHDHKLQVHFDQVRQMDKANFTIWRYFFRFDNFSNRNKKVEVKLLTNSKRFHVLHTILRRGDKHWALLTLPGVYRFFKNLSVKFYRCHGNASRVDHEPEEDLVRIKTKNSSSSEINLS